MLNKIHGKNIMVFGEKNFSYYIRRAMLKMKHTKRNKKQDLHKEGV